MITTVKRRLHRDIVADPLLHGLVLNLYLNGEQLSAPRRPTTSRWRQRSMRELEALMRRHMAEEDRHIALYTRAIQKLEQPVLELPLPDIYNEVIRRHTTASFAIAAADDLRRAPAQARAFLRAPAFPREARSPARCEYHVDACAHAVSDYPEKAVSTVLRDELRHVSYTREVVRHLLPAGEAARGPDVARARRAARKPRFLGTTARSPAARACELDSRGCAGAFYRGCTSLLRGALACA